MASYDPLVAEIPTSTEPSEEEPSSEGSNYLSEYEVGNNETLANAETLILSKISLSSETPKNTELVGTHNSVASSSTHFYPRIRAYIRNFGGGLLPEDGIHYKNLRTALAHRKLVPSTAVTPVQTSTNDDYDDDDNDDDEVTSEPPVDLNIGICIPPDEDLEDEEEQDEWETRLLIRRFVLGQQGQLEFVGNTETSIDLGKILSWDDLAQQIRPYWLTAYPDKDGYPSSDQLTPTNCWPGAATIFGRNTEPFEPMNYPLCEWTQVKNFINGLVVIEFPQPQQLFMQPELLLHAQQFVKIVKPQQSMRALQPQEPSAIAICVICQSYCQTLSSPIFYPQLEPPQEQPVSHFLVIWFEQPEAQQEREELQEAQEQQEPQQQQEPQEQQRVSIPSSETDQEEEVD